MDGQLDAYRFLPSKDAKNQYILTVYSQPGGYSSCFRTVRPLPEGGGWFESVWQEFDQRTANIQQQFHERNKLSETTT